MRRWIGLACLVAGCGDQIAGPDAADPRVRLRLTTEDVEPAPGLPIAGARLAVVADGGAPALLTTDADGVARFAVDHDATAIVLRDDLAAPRLYLVTGIGPGAMIELGAPPPPAPTSVAGELAVTYVPYPGGPWVYDNDYYPCTDGGITSTQGLVEIATETGCEAVARTMYLTARDPGTGAEVAYAGVPGVAAVPGALAAGGWETGTTYEVTIADAPPAIVGAYTELVHADSWRMVIVNTVVAAGTGTGTHRNATMPGAAAARTRLDPAAPGLRQWLAEPMVLPPAITIDASRGLIPFVSDVAFDPATREVSWTATGGDPATLVYVALKFPDPMTGLTFDWAVYAPAGATRVVIPDVPDELTAYDLRPTGAVLVRQLWLVAVGGASYVDLLTDVDLAVDDFESEGYRPDRASRLSGGDLF